MVAPVLFSTSGISPLPAQPPVDATVPTGRVNAFQDAMARHAEAQQPVASPAMGSQADLDAQTRARRGLGLEAVEAKPAAAPAGDMILDGLQRLRGVFDAREARLNEVMSTSGTDARSLMAMQVEMTNFTMLVDISSKLTGKSTQVFETLMKGQ